MIGFKKKRQHTAPDTQIFQKLDTPRTPRGCQVIPFLGVNGAAAFIYPQYKKDGEAMPNPNLTVVEVETATLVPYAGNAKEHPEWQVGQIVRSITEFGFNDPIGVWHNEDGDPIIVEGHGRLLAAKELGMDTVPVVYLDHLDDEARRAYTLVHNQTTMNSGFDEGVLNAELASLDGIDMKAYGFDDATMDDVEDPKETKSLIEEYAFTPFTVINGQDDNWLAHADYWRGIFENTSLIQMPKHSWQERKIAWINLGIQSELGRGDE